MVGTRGVGSLPRLFLDHFYATSFVAEVDSQLVGFLVGFCSPGRPREAYIHFVGIEPKYRSRGLGHALYELFFVQASRAECGLVRAITPPTNADSIAFHMRLGFEASRPVTDYNGPSRDMVLFKRTLDVEPG